MSKVNNYINEMRKFVTLSKLAYDAWFTLVGENSEKYDPICEKFPTHIKFSSYSYLSTLITTLYMTMENDKKTINTWQLLKLLKHGEQFKPGNIKHIEAELSKAKIIWSKIRTLRCKQFAHCNYESSLSGAFKEAGMKPIEFKEFISQLEGIINYISGIYNGSTHAFNSDDKYSTKQFMDSLLH